MTSTPGGLEQTLFGGRFQIGELLGSGGSAAVYRCADFGDLDAEGRPRIVALKVLHPALSEDPALREAFLREAERLAEVKQSNVARVYASGLQSVGSMPRAWIAMEAVEGPTVAEWVASHGPLGPYQAVSVMDGLLSGLQAAHAAGLVHRDVAVGNVILHDVGPGQLIDPASVRLVDFGLADAAGGTVVGADVLLATGAKHTATVVGSAHYLSPEQAAGESVGPASDLYQAGAVLYFLLTGQPPFVRATLAEAVRARLSDPPPVPSAVTASARRLDRVVVKALARDPQVRFASAEEFRASLLAAVAASPGDGPTRVMEVGWADPSPASIRALSAPLRSPDPVPEAASGMARLIAPVLIGALVIAVVAWIGFAVTDVGSLAAVPIPTAASGSPVASATPTPSAVESSAAAAPQQVRVPALYGDLAAAQTAVIAAGLEVGRVRSRDSAEPSGRVLGQSPASGALVAPGDTVDVTVASGYNRVPAVAGMTVTAAQAVLESAGFTLVVGELDPAAVVADSQPAARARLLLGVRVALVAGVDASTPATPLPSDSASG